MFKVTRYFVKGGQGRREGPFRELEEANALAAGLARRGRSARVFAVTGEPVFDLWERPRLVAAYRANDA